MAANDILLIDGIIDDRIDMRLPSNKRDEAFEYLSIEQILKDFDLSTDEIKYGIIDGRQDGGIDGYYIFVNGHLLQDPESFMWPRANSELKIVLISCKHHDTFRQATLDALIATFSEFFNYSIEDEQLTGAYSVSLLSKRKNLKYALRKLSPRLGSLSINVNYASRGDTSEIGEEVVARGKQIEELSNSNFHDCTSKFAFFGARELVELHRKKPNYTLELPFTASLAKGERYVVLARLIDYYQFISSEGKLRRYLFESNVRDFLGLNRVNEDIKATLEKQNSPDFWCLNNGVTILATSANIVGNSIHATDVQIVNGLQTSESIYRHFINNNTHPPLDDRCILVKVIVTKNKEMCDEIIRATNNQTDVELASLHATDPIQRDIEDIMLRYGLYYERRKNYYANQGHKPSELVTPLYAAAGFIALILKAPNKSTSLKSKFMRKKVLYDAVFNDNAHLQAWPIIVKVLKKVDTLLESIRPTGKATDNFLKRWRYIIALILISKEFKKFSFNSKELATFDIEIITIDSLQDIYSKLTNAQLHMNHKNSFNRMIQVCNELAESEGIADVEILENPKYPPMAWNQKKRKKKLTNEFLEQVKNALPPQPWKKNTHIDIAKILNCDIWQCRAAINKLISDGIFYRQYNGVLYDADNNIISSDSIENSNDN